MVPILIILLSMKGCICVLTPPGCSYNSEIATCDFQLWSPPILDAEFGLQVHQLKLININGTIPDGAFSGLNGSRAENDTSIEMSCNTGITTRLSREIFTSNLHWVTDLYIFDCHLENGLPPRLLENLTRLKSLTISRGSIKGLVAPDTLAGLTNLLSIFIDGPISSGRLPLGFFQIDSLNTLAKITLRSAELEFIHPDWFYGLVSLERITLKKNHLRSLPSGLFDGLRSLTDVRLSGNPWNCSCELRWLLAWSHIIDGVVCQSPASVQTVALESAADLLNCPLAPSTSRSTSMSFKPETPGTQINPITTFEVLMGTSVSTVLNTNRIASTFTLTDPISMQPSTAIITKRLLSATSNIGTASIIFTSSNVPISISSSADATEYKLSTIQPVSSSSSIFSAHPTFVQAVSFSIPKKSSCQNSRNTNDGFVNNIRSVIIISSVSVFTLLIVLAAFLYRCVYQNKRSRK